MTRRLAVLTMTAVVALVSGLARAHGGHDHIMGTVTAVDATHVEVAAKDGKKISVAIGADTKYFKSNAAAAAADLKVGLRVVIDAAPKDGGLEAREIRIGSSGSAKAPAEAPAPPKP